MVFCEIYLFVHALNHMTFSYTTAEDMARVIRKLQFFYVDEIAFPFSNFLAG